MKKSFAQLISHENFIFKKDSYFTKKWLARMTYLLEKKEKTQEEKDLLARPNFFTEIFY
jgi:hypothetical protein